MLTKPMLFNMNIGKAGLSSLILLVASPVVFAQTKIQIDTIEVSYRIPDLVDITSFIPQIGGDINSVVRYKINSDIKGYFMAGIQKDSATYVRELLEDYGFTTVEEYLEMDISDIEPDEESEEFEITYLSENLLNLTYSYQIFPHGGRYGFFFTNILYDLGTGEKLNFNDFISIGKDTLLSIFRKDGYRMDWNSVGDTQYIKVPVGEYEADVEKNISELFVESDDRCIEFYFIEKNSELHLMFKFECAGPNLLDYGIELRYLKPFIKYSEFKNKF